jgi:two-component system, cell cycle sensor histidine kinase and response regulator CckA
MLVMGGKHPGIPGLLRNPPDRDRVVGIVVWRYVVLSDIDALVDINIPVHQFHSSSPRMSASVERHVQAGVQRPLAIAVALRSAVMGVAPTASASIASDTAARRAADTFGSSVLAHFTSAEMLILGVEAALLIAALAVPIVMLRRMLASRDAALKSTERRYSSFVSRSAEGVWCFEFTPPIPIDLPVEEQIRLCYERGRMIEANDAMARMYGFERAEQIVAIPWRELLPPDDPRNIEYLRAIIQNGYRIDDAESHERDVAGGERIFLNTLLGVVEKGAFVRAWGTQRDITERRKAERALDDARQKLELAVASADIGVWRLHFRSDRLECDRRYLQFFDINHEPGLIDRRLVLERIHPDDRERIEEAVRAACDGDGIYRCEYRIRLSDAGTRWISSRGTVKRGESGRPEILTGVSLDITQSKLAEIERERIEQRLRQSQRMESLGVLAGGIAHDFNNLLVAISGNASLVADRLPANSELRPLISAIESAAARAGEQTRQLLAYAGRGSPQPVRFDLAPMVRESIDAMDHAAGISIRMVSDLPDPSRTAHVDADPVLIRQAIDALLANALEAIDQHSGEIRVRVFESELCANHLARMHVAGSTRPGRFFGVEIVDNGSGIPPDAMARVFEPFYTTKFAGRGLGLTSALGILRSHHGAITVDSKPGEGTRVRFHLPAVGPSPESPRIQREAAAGATSDIADLKPIAARDGVLPSSRTILIVDDEPMVRNVARISLERAGFRVVDAPDGAGAIETISRASGEISGVLLDMTMPRMSGPEVFAELRKVRADLPVLLTSGFTEQDSAETLLAEPKVAFIQKPYRPTQLVGAMNRLIDCGA